MKTAPVITQKAYLDIFNVELKLLHDLTSSRNSRYAKELDAFANFSAIEQLTHGRVTAVDGILTRIMDKISRFTNMYYAGELKPKGKGEEAPTSDLQDLAVYSLILKIIIDIQLQEERSSKTILMEKT